MTGQPYVLYSRCTLEAIQVVVEQPASVYLLNNSLPFLKHHACHVFNVFFFELVWHYYLYKALPKQCEAHKCWFPERIFHTHADYGV